MKKILVVSNMYPSEKFPFYGIFVKRFCDQLDTLGIMYDLSVMHKGSSKFEKIRNYIAFYFGTFFKCLFGKYERVYVHYASYSTPSVLFARKIKNFNLIINAHGSDVVPENSKHERMQKYTKRAFNIADRIVVPSEYFKALIEEKYQLNRDKIFVYPSGGVDFNVFRPLENEEEKFKILREFGLDKNKKHIGYVGRMSSGKGWLTFIDGVARVLEKNNEIEVVIAGDGPEAATIVQEIKNKNLEKRVVRLPLLSQEQLSKLYRILDIFVFPTERAGESLGLVAIEAMASGAVVIASDYAAPKYYIQDQVNGYKFDMGNSLDCESQILNYIQLNTIKQQQIRNNSMKTAQNYSSKKVRNILLRVINDL